MMNALYQLTLASPVSLCRAVEECFSKVGLLWTGEWTLDLYDYGLGLMAPLSLIYISKQVPAGMRIEY